MVDSSARFQPSTLPEAARILGVSESTVRRLVKAGKLEAERVAAWMTSVLEPLIVGRGTGRQRIEDLARENGRQAAERELAASIAVNLSDDLDAARAQTSMLEARPGTRADEADPRESSRPGAPGGSGWGS